jgi:hypothetical protein
MEILDQLHQGHSTRGIRYHTFWITPELLSSIHKNVLANLVPYTWLLEAPPALRPAKSCPVGMVKDCPPPLPYAVALLLPLAELPPTGTEVLPRKIFNPDNDNSTARLTAAAPSATFAALPVPVPLFPPLLPPPLPPPPPFRRPML